MYKADSKKNWRVFITLYLALMYLTSGVAPGICNRLNRILWGNGVYAIYFAGVVLVLLTLVYLFFMKRERSVKKYILFFVFVFIIALLDLFAVYPAEKIHLVEFGLLAVAVYKALEPDHDKYGFTLYAKGTAICFAAAFVDEIIQYAVPGRFFDLRDIAVCVCMSVTVFLIIRFIFLK
ncbi:MAG: VanZ family protein, partial [Candidatus Omnitrophota bacterium]